MTGSGCYKYALSSSSQSLFGLASWCEFGPQYTCGGGVVSTALSPGPIQAGYFFMSPRHSSPYLDVDGSQVTNPASSSPISHSDQAESSDQQKMQISTPRPCYAPILPGTKGQFILGLSFFSCQLSNRLKLIHNTYLVVQLLSWEECFYIHMVKLVMHYHVHYLRAKFVHKLKIISMKIWQQLYQLKSQRSNQGIPTQDRPCASSLKK